MNQEDWAAMSYFKEISGAPVIELIAKLAPTKVMTRVIKAEEHATKAIKLIGLDEEMGYMRLVAAEEELVVAIFEQLKLSDKGIPEHKDFVRKFKNHYVKLTFLPVLAHFMYIFRDFVEPGVVLKSPQLSVHWSVDPLVTDEKVALRFTEQISGQSYDLNPFNIQLMLDEDDDDEEASMNRLHTQFVELILRQSGQTVRDFISSRAEFRNHLLYASDAGSLIVEEPLEQAIKNNVNQGFSMLLWTLAALLSNLPLSKDWGVVSQFISLYRRILQDCGLLKHIQEENG